MATQNNILGGSRVHSLSEATKSYEQIASDEALARILQEEEENLLIEALPAHHTGVATAVPSARATDLNSIGSSIQVRQEDIIDPDNMTYEELQQLGEAVGTESRGLSDELIAYLAPYKFKSGGFFSKKRIQEECVICKLTFKNGQKLIKLGCQHAYHADCITRWLKINKACPVCNEEVFG